MLIFHSENHPLASSLTSTADAATDRVSSGGDSEASPDMSLREQLYDRANDESRACVSSPLKEVFAVSKLASH
jgi:hypothetical protein